MGDIDPYVSERYEITKRLGKGAYGIVWKAVDRRNRRIVALKKIYDAFRNQTDAQRTYREIWFLQEFHSHPNIIELLEVVKAKNNRDIYLVFNFMEIDLHCLIKSGKIREEWKQQFIIFQLLSALAYIHSANVIHRDLKPSNILLNCQYHLKLADFGLARSLELSDELTTDPVLTEYVATRWYRAPEILLGSKHYTKGIDIWSMGCIMGEILCSKPLFPGTSTLNQVEKIMAALPHPSQADVESLCAGYAACVLERAANKPKRLLNDILPDCSKEAFDLLCRFITLNPNRRITAKDSLLHPYVSKYYGKELATNLDKKAPPLCDHTKLSVNQYRNKLYEMIGENLSTKSASTSSESNLSPNYLAKMNEKRIIIKERTYEVPTIDERKEAFLRSQLSKKQTIPPMARKTLNPPFLSDKGKFSLGFNHPVILRGSDICIPTVENEKEVEKKVIVKYGRRQFGNQINNNIASSVKFALQNYRQDNTYGTIAASALQAIKQGRL